MPLRKRILLVLTLFLLVSGIHNASADIGPPSNPPGQNIEPGSTIPTDVRMEDKRVVVAFTHVPTAASLSRPALPASQSPTATDILSQATERSQPGWLIPGLLVVVALLLLALGLCVRVFARRHP